MMVKSCDNCKHDLDCAEKFGICGRYKTCLTCICDTCKYASCCSKNAEDKWEEKTDD